MTATYTFDVVATLDGFGSYRDGAAWGGWWGKQGPEFLDHRLGLYAQKQRMVFGATTFRETTTQGGEPEAQDPWVGAADFDLDLVESRTLDGRTLVLLYRPTRHA